MKLYRYLKDPITRTLMVRVSMLRSSRDQHQIQIIDFLDRIANYPDSTSGILQIVNSNSMCTCNGKLNPDFGRCMTKKQSSDESGVVSFNTSTFPIHTKLFYSSINVLITGQWSDGNRLFNVSVNTP